MCCLFLPLKTTQLRQIALSAEFIVFANEPASPICSIHVKQNSFDRCKQLTCTQSPAKHNALVVHTKRRFPEYAKKEKKA